jgi:P4 family phage/plasmid primase-like protien
VNADTTPLDAALFWVERTFFPVPVRFRSKKPYNPDDSEGRNWQNLRLTAETAAHFFNCRKQNIGILLGDDFGSADVDLDCPEAASVAPIFLPDTGMKFGRASKPGSHWLYRIDPRIPSETFKDPTDGKMLVELRCLDSDGSVGHQTVVPPSVHDKSGEAIRFEDGFDRHPANLDAALLQTAVRTIAAAALLARQWPRSGEGRHETMLALAGVLQRSGWAEDDAVQFCRAVYRAVRDHDPNAITRTEGEVRDTFRNAETGRATTGIPSLRKHFDQRLIDSALRWLGIDSAHERYADKLITGDNGKPADADHIAVYELAEAIGGKHRFARDAGGRLYVFRSGSYHPDGASMVRQQVKQLLERMRLSSKWSSHKAEEVVKYIEIDAPLLWERPEADVVNVLNGLLHVKTRTLSPHSADFLSPVQLPLNFDPDARCPMWDKFIAEVFPGDSEAIAWEIPAWLMTPDTSIQKAVLLTGDGANGKSTYLRAVLAFLGRPNVAALSLHRLENDRFSVARLLGKLANICPDLPSGDLSSTSIFKAITGGDALLAERKFEESFEFIPYSRLIFSANHPPKSQDASSAFFRRWIVVPFERTFRAGDPGTISRDRLDSMLSDPAELSGVLNKAIEAIAAIRSRGLNESESMRRATDEFRQTTDPLAVWLDRTTGLEPEALIPSDQLWRDYNRDCIAKGRPTVSKTALGIAIAQLRPSVEKRQRTINGTLAWCYVGIGPIAAGSATMHS